MTRTRTRNLAARLRALERQAQPQLPPITTFTDAAGKKWTNNGGLVLPVPPATVEEWEAEAIAQQAAAAREQEER